MGGHVFRSSRCYDLTALVSALGTQVDDPVGRLDDLQIVLDYEDGVAGIGQAVQDVQELSDVMEVQSGGRLVQRYTASGRCPVC